MAVLVPVVIGETVAAVGEAIVVPGFLDKDQQFERILQKHKDKSADEAVYLAGALRECGEIGYGTDDPAKYCMNRFLSNTGGTWEFEWNELFAGDATVKDRVYSEIVRRTLRLLTQREKEKLAGVDESGVISPSERWRRANQPIAGSGVLSPKSIAERLDAVIDPNITIFQRNFSSPAWWGALGTFPATFERVGVSNDGSQIAVKLTGTNSYDWHPDDEKRSTQTLHQWAARLVELNVAKPFTMSAKARTMMVNVASQSLEDVGVWFSDSQVNPTMERDRAGIAKRLIKSYF